jgi:cupin 2 domain-containing protein
MTNVFASLPTALLEELVERLVDTPAVTIERIVSTGHRTPAGEWYDQDTDEFVLLLRGRAALRFEDASALAALAPGDWLDIPAHRRHRVEWTDPAAPTVWLAVHYRRRS